MKKKTRKDWTKEVADKLIKQLENGTVPWVKPWEHWTSWRRCGVDYLGVNQLLLSGGEYITAKQARKEGGWVNKGAKAEYCVNYKEYYKTVKDEDGNVVLDDNGEEVKELHRSLKAFPVFKIEDTTLEQKSDRKHIVHRWKPENKAEKIIKAYCKKYNVPYHSGGNRAFQNDLTGVTVPKKEQFKSAVLYYHTMFHELVHSTHAEMGRDLSRYGKDKKERAREELVAEIGACYILSYLGLEKDFTLANTAAYVKSWAQHLKDDKAAITYAAPKAIEAANLILNA